MQLGFPPTGADRASRHHRRRVRPTSRGPAGGRRLRGIFTAGEGQIQPTPDIAAETAKLFLRGVIAMNGRLIGVIDIANLLPPSESIAA